MGLKNDKWIREQGDKLLSPFEPKLVNKSSKGDPMISYGTSSYGYDLVLAGDLLVASHDPGEVMDPKFSRDRNWRGAARWLNGAFIIPPNSFALGRSVEYVTMPRNVMGICLGKSTYARVGIHCLTTPIEPGWQGHITLEFANLSPHPALIYPYEGCAQLLFFEGDEPPDVSYADRCGKYQGQVGITLSKV